MKAKKVFNIVMTVINCLLILASIAGSVYIAFVAEKDFSFMKITGFVAIVSLISALLYCCMGGKKDEAFFYKFFTLMFAFSELFSVIGSSESGMVATGLNAVAFAFVLTVALSQNLGKFMSITLTFLTFVLRLICFIKYVPDLFSSLSTVAICTAAQFAMSSVLLICTYEKYLDKEERKKKEEEAAANKEENTEKDEKAK